MVMSAIDLKNPKKTATILEDPKINVKIKLSALWVTLMFFYLYNDVFTFFQPGIIEEIVAGEVAGFRITQVFLLGAAILMAIPIFMIFLSLTLKAKANRWANIILGIFYTGLVLITQFGILMDTSVNFLFSGIVEVVLTALIVWYALKWPKQEA